MTSVGWRSGSRSIGTLNPVDARVLGLVSRFQPFTNLPPSREKKP